MHTTDTASISASSLRYAQCIAASRRIRWDLEHDVIRGRRLDFGRHFLPEGLARTARLDFLDAAGRRFLSQVQGRTYANMFGLVERFIGIKMLELSSRHWFGDQVALEAVVRFSDEELKHQALFRRIEALAAEGMPPGYEFAARPNGVAAQVLQSSTWAVLALTCHIELFTQVHYRHSIAPDAQLCELYKDVFLFHWKEESQHAIVDELEWLAEDARLQPLERDRAVEELATLVHAVDGLLVEQAEADARYFERTCGHTAETGSRPLQPGESARVAASLLDAYRWQYIVSGLQDQRFSQLLARLLSADQGSRLKAWLQPLLG